MQQRCLYFYIMLILIAVISPSAYAACAASPSQKTLCISVAPSNSGIDPAQHGDSLSLQLQEALFDRLLTYDYLARPAKLVPLAAIAMPLVSNAGKTFTFKLRKGIWFTSQTGKLRELVAEDVAYSIKRHANPANKSPSRDLFVGKIVGLEQLETRHRTQGNLGLDVNVAGLEIRDRYTIRIHLLEADYDFPYTLAHPSASIVARESFDLSSANATKTHFGSGAFLLAQWIANERISLVANAEYAVGVPHQARTIGASGGEKTVRMASKIERIEIFLERDPAARWRSFVEGSTDYIDRLTATNIEQALTNGKLVDSLAMRGIKLYSAPEPEIIYYYLNFRDAVVGGFAADKKALRRAILQSYNVDEEIREIRKGSGNVAYSLIPPGVNGHNPKYRTSLAYDPANANKTLDNSGYKRGVDGWRLMPDGSPLVVTFSSEPLDGVRPYALLRKKGLAEIGIQMETRLQSYAENLQAIEKCDLAFWGAAWRATLPTERYFFQLLYGKNIGRNNFACYQSQDFDALYEAAKKMPDGNARRALYERMARLVEDDGVWQLGVNRVAHTLLKPRVLGYVGHPILHSHWQYLDLRNAD
jgi:ABC-type transport system substrate-binding protein